MDVHSIGESVRVVVVDNDPAGSAQNVVDRVRGDIGLDVRYVREERAGIPFARNAAVHEAVGGGDRCLAFVDDDEVVETRWLTALCTQMRESGADAVAGPVITEYEEGTPEWVCKSGVFDYPRRESGTEIGHCFTNNVLVQCGALEQMGETGWFDERMVMTGGSDAHLFRRFTGAGFSIVWCDEAVVRETLPMSRATMGWILRRGYRIGASGAFIDRDLRGCIGIARNLVVGAARVVQGAVLGAMSAPLGRAAMVRQLRMGWYGAGLIAGTFGARYDEYSRVHGR
jgi:glycosyltransferase involved in cell wall biosynthesis